MSDDLLECVNKPQVGNTPQTPLNRHPKVKTASRDHEANP